MSYTGDLPFLTKWSSREVVLHIRIVVKTLELENGAASF